MHSVGVPGVRILGVYCMYSTILSSVDPLIMHVDSSSTGITVQLSLRIFVSPHTQIVEEAGTTANIEHRGSLYIAYYPGVVKRWAMKLATEFHKLWLQHFRRPEYMFTTTAFL